MVARGSLVPVLVVSSDPSHQLLCLHFNALFQFIRKVERLSAAKCCCYSAMVQYLNVAVLPLPMSEAEISFEGLLHRELAVDLRPNV